MSSASEKAADRMHADLSAMILDAQRHQDSADGTDAYYEWQTLKRMLMAARGQATKCMNERDRRIAQG